MVMASFNITPISATFHRLQLPSTSQLTPILSPQQLGINSLTSRRNRGSLLVTKGGAPGATTYLFAFIFPLSLLAVTIFTSIKISDKLDKDFYEEMEVNQSILEAEDEDGEVVGTTTEEKVPRSRTRNRPKREIEVFGK